MIHSALAHLTTSPRVRHIDGRGPRSVISRNRFLRHLPPWIRVISLGPWVPMGMKVQLIDAPSLSQSAPLKTPQFTSSFIATIHPPGLEKPLTWMGRLTSGTDPRTVPDLGSVCMHQSITLLVDYQTSYPHYLLFSLRHTIEAFQDIQGLVHLM